MWFVVFLLMQRSNPKSHLKINPH